MTRYQDKEAHRLNRNYSQGELRKRVFYQSLVAPLLRIIPRPLYEWRNHIYRRLGARIGQDVRIYPNVGIFHPWMLEIGDFVTIGPEVSLYNLGKIKIGRHTLISQSAHLCAGTHNEKEKSLPLLRSNITIGEEVWICADAFIGPGVQVGDGAIIGARAVVTSDVGEAEVVVGNPAKRIRKRAMTSASD